MRATPLLLSHSHPLYKGERVRVRVTDERLFVMSEPIGNHSKGGHP